MPRFKVARETSGQFTPFDKAVSGETQDLMVEEGMEFQSHRLVDVHGDFHKFLVKEGFLWVRTEDLDVVPDPLDHWPRTPTSRPSQGELRGAKIAPHEYRVTDSLTGTSWEVFIAENQWCFQNLETGELRVGFPNKRAALLALDQYLSLRRWDPMKGWTNEGWPGSSAEDRDRGQQGLSEA